MRRKAWLRDDGFSRRDLTSASICIANVPVPSNHPLPLRFLWMRNMAVLYFFIYLFLIALYLFTFELILKS